MTPQLEYAVKQLTIPLTSISTTTKHALVQLKYGNNIGDYGEQAETSTVELTNKDNISYIGEI